MDAKPASEATSSKRGTGIFRRPLKPLKPTQEPEDKIPNRYLIKEDEGGRFLTCLEAPEVKVRVDRGFSETASAARKYPKGTIFLDGAAQGEPFLDLDRRVYNLDHHECCVRPFTLATCEQALVLVLRGLDLRERPWTLFASEPDLDTVLAIWVLLNSMHLQSADSAIRAEITPLVRLEGAIDSHGLELREFCGFPEILLDRMHRRLEQLRGLEVESKSEQTWSETDPLEYLASVLARTDQLIYPPGYFEEFRGIEELTKVELADNRIAVVCRSDEGIYELEKDLKRLYGKRLGVVIQQKDSKTYTVRQVDPFLPVNLEAAYRKLNVMDSSVRASGKNNRWGGSAEIGGSPRKSGTSLGPGDIAEIFRLAYRRPTGWERAKAVGLSVLWSGAALVAGWTFAVIGHQVLSGRGPKAEAGMDPLGFLVPALVVALALLTGLVGRRRRRLYGLRLPVGRSWLAMIPVSLVAGGLGGAWAYPAVAGGSVQTLGASGWWMLLGFPLLAEVVFRGLAHGALLRDFSVQHSSGKWFLSCPVALSAMLYALWSIPCWLAFSSPVGSIWPSGAFLLTPLAAYLGGVAFGMARERSGSLLSSLLLHWLAVASALAVARLSG